MNTGSKKRRYITGFDGIRTLAVIGVILYHLVPYDIQGGFLGVPIFFVLSGYLITDILNEEIQKKGKANLFSFYKKRMKRLYPGLVTMIVATSAYITLFQRSLLNGIRSVIFGNLLYVYNWVQVKQGQSYFDRFEVQSPFTHLWSLSIEGQFYFFWPIVLTVLWVLLRKKQPIFDTIFLIAFFSALTMALLYKDGQDSSRIYFGTDTRMFSILLGTSLAIVWPSKELKTTLQKKSRMILDGVGIVSLGLIVWMFFSMSGESDLTYHGGMFFFSLISMFLIATVAHPGADMNKLLTNPVFTWLGKRSYGIYLYQYPVMIFYESHVQNIAAHPWLHVVIEISLIVIISHLSYRYIELPLQHFDYSRTKEVVQEFFKKKSRYGWQRLWVVGALLLILLTMTGAVFQPNAQSNQSGKQLEDVIKRNQKEVAEDNKKLQGKEKQNTGSASSSSQKNASSSSESAQSSSEPDQLTQQQQQKAAAMKITAIGDSVLADGSVKLRSIFQQMYIDAKVGRQPRDAIGILNGLAQKRQLDNTVLLSLGTNGPFNDEELHQIMGAIGNRRVYWINTHVPTRRWQKQVNDSLSAATKTYPNLRVIDWYDYSNNHNNWFYDDDVHPNEYGLNYYGNFIAKEILEDK
ncbi:acyltransferase family protein [Liquorilactobacillus mali]|uniref:Acyltransferase n=1 Tax=Liquorilactobacillus mali KCTC 3596 = DSM 20444 TaxID=1046596 RepID=J1F1A3_9LACO|nr:acyltransferase family protein [Liquorilactobacillus mali]EJE98187.1 acyltransferase [Liquorilactobacillus mali KCTC 3596 = DSM 20444]KRN10524.1 acyltransferase [Liquorilactobacillus mali KCTC 3596 = DSM 20444]MDC7951891.1 acetyltransferase [Liquorilactobacillus mali]QFQ75059.1 acetyltransferase [Liquorilactobacillus mali]